jgi:hypothetical protein
MGELEKFRGLIWIAQLHVFADNSGVNFPPDNQEAVKLSAFLILQGFPDTLENFSGRLNTVADE